PGATHAFAGRWTIAHRERTRTFPRNGDPGGSRPPRFGRNRMNPRAAETTNQPGPRPVVIGWKEYLEFPEWGELRVKAKIDTGARTSVLDAVSYELREADGQGLVAELRLALHPRHPERLTRVSAPVRRMIVVRNSSGMPEQRP